MLVLLGGGMGLLADLRPDRLRVDPGTCRVGACNR
jgi:hypothetical protein